MQALRTFFPVLYESVGQKVVNCKVDVSMRNCTSHRHSQLACTCLAIQSSFTASTCCRHNTDGSLLGRWL